MEQVSIEDEQLSLFLDPSHLLFQKTSFSIDYETPPWQHFSDDHNQQEQQEMEQKRSDDSCFSTSRTEGGKHNDGIERDDCSTSVKAISTFKRSRIDDNEPTPSSNNLDGENNDEVSRLELNTVQLFTSILARFNQGNDSIDENKQKNDDYFIISSFQKLKDIISIEMNYIENMLKKEQKHDCDQNYSSLMFRNLILVDEKKEHSGNDDQFNRKEDVEISTNASLYKMNNMLFLMLGYTMSKKIDINLPYHYLSPDDDDARNGFTQDRCVFTKYLLDLINILHQYNKKRNDLWTKGNNLLYQEHTSFHLSESDLQECFTVIQRALYQISYDLMLYISRTPKDEFTVTGLNEFFQIIHACIDIMQSLEATWLSNHKSLTRSVNLLDLIMTVIPMTKHFCIQNNSNLQLDQHFNSLVDKVLLFLHTSANKNTYSIISSCAEIVFYHDEEGYFDAQNEQIIRRNYDLLLRLLSSIQKTSSPVMTESVPSWKILFDEMNNVLNYQTFEVKKMLIISNYLARSKSLRTHLMSNLPFLRSIIRYTSYQTLRDFNHIDADWINTKAIRILSFLLATDAEQSVFEVFTEIANLDTSMIVKVEFILGIDVALRKNSSLVEDFLDKCQNSRLKSFYEVYWSIATYQGASFHLLSYGREVAMRSLCTLCLSCKSEHCFNAEAFRLIEHILTFDRSCEEVFLNVFSKSMTHLETFQAPLVSFLRDSAILGKMAIDSAHLHQTRENTMLLLKNLSNHEALIWALARNDDVIESISYYLTFHGRSKKTQLMRYCALELSVKMAESTLCLQHLMKKHSKLVNLWIDTASKISIHFESYIDCQTRAKAGIKLPSDEKKTIKRRLEQCVQCCILSKERQRF